MTWYSGRAELCEESGARNASTRRGPLGSSLQQNVDRGRRTVDGGDAPAVFGEPKRVAARPARQVERRAGRGLPGSLHYKRGRREIRVAQAVTLVPIANVHIPDCRLNR